MEDDRVTLRSMALLLFAISAFLPSSAGADAASGNSVRLETYSLSAAGSSNQSSATTRADISVGQPEPTGVSQGSTVTLELGFWPTTVPEPGRLVRSLGALGTLALLIRVRQERPS
jgi:hypothetical protein